MVKSSGKVIIKPHNIFVKLAFRIFKNIAGKISGKARTFKDIYTKALIPLYFDAYLSVILLSFIFVFTSIFVFSTIIHYFILQYSMITSISLSLLMSLIITGIVIWILIANPLYRASSLSRKIDSILPHVVGYIASLASAGLSMEHILLKTVELKPEPTLTNLATLIVRDIHVFGQDILTALRNAISRSPSKTFTSLLNGVVNTISTSGDLRSYFLYECEKLIAKKREQLRKATENLSYISEIYIALVVVGPVILVIMLIIMSMLGGFLIDPIVLILVLTFIGIPVLGSVFILLIDIFAGGA